MHPNDTTLEIPYGYCQCGCGEPTTIAKVSNRYFGYIKGEPLRFVQGHSSRNLAPETRFWQYVTIGQPDDCWLWTGTLNNRGYGVLGIDNHHVLTHRLSWEIHNGPIPEHESYHGMCVLHRCDRRQCVNPAHLFLGTNADNIDDMIQKGRYNRHKKSNKLNESDVTKIRQLAAQGIKQAQIAREFGVGEATVSNVIHRKVWAHVP